MKFEVLDLLLSNLNIWLTFYLEMNANYASKI